MRLGCVCSRYFDKHHTFHVVCVSRSMWWCILIGDRHNGCGRTTSKGTGGFSSTKSTSDTGLGLCSTRCKVRVT